MTSPTKPNPRKPGRGFRPYLLLPKVLAVAVYFGSIVAAAAIWFTQPDNQNTQQQLHTLNLVANLVAYLGVPALTLAIVLGIALTLQATKIMLRQRWLQVKLLLIILAVPTLHLFMASRAHALRSAIQNDVPTHHLSLQFSIGFIFLILGSAALIIISRHKPRFGQNWARDYPRPKTPAKP